MRFSINKSIFVGGLLFLCTAVCATAQDLLARQAPIDRKIKASDSVALKVLRQSEMRMAGSELYAASWNNDKVHCYNSSMLPDSFRIDLRGFHMPTTSRNVTSHYGYRPAFRRMHKGIDVKVYTGDTIYAAFDGKVRVVKYEANGYGNFVVIRHPNGLETIYGHLSKHLVSADEEVRAGTPIGLGGNTGRSFGSHLHFETRLLNEALDPALLFDFKNQDVTGDFFTYYKDGGNKNHRYLAQQASSGNDEEPSAKMEKEEPIIATRFYKVNSGESLTSIANKLGITLDLLCRANHMTINSRIRPGQILRY